jgi:hypothetical protein
MFDGKETWGDRATNCGRHMEYGFNDWGNVSVADEAANQFRYTLNGAPYLDPRNQDVMYGDGVMGDNDFAVGVPNEDGILIDDGVFKYLPYDGTSSSGYKWKKYCMYEDFAHVDIGDQGDYSSILIRVADVKLLIAEACIAKGDYTKAKNLINEVRTRDAVKAEPYNDLNAGNAFDILKRERYIELFGEQQCWFDLVRWDRLGKINMTSELKTSNAKYKKFPIPTEEKETNPLMVIHSDDWN